MIALIFWFIVTFLEIFLVYCNVYLFFEVDAVFFDNEHEYFVWFYLLTMN